MRGWIVAVLFVLSVAAIVLGGCAKQISQPALSLKIPADEIIYSKKAYQVENKSAQAFTGFVKVMVPFEKGEFYGKTWQEAKTKTPVVLTPIKWHIEDGKKGSVAIAQAVFPMTLPPNSKVAGTLYTGGSDAKAPSPFLFGHHLFKLAASGALNNSLFSAIKVNGQYCIAGMGGAAKLINANEYSATFRFRDYFRCNNVAMPHASFTMYITVYSGQDFGEVTAVFGNDNVAAPVGQFNFEEWSMISLDPMQIDPVYGSAFGVAPQDTLLGFKRHRISGTSFIADGQSVAVKFKYIVKGDAAQEASYQAALGMPIGEAIGVAHPTHWVQSKSLGVNGFIPNPKFPNVTAGFNALNHYCNQNLTYGAFDHAGLINKNPPATGDQPDFMAASPVWAIQVVQTQNACPMRMAFAGVYKEALRPQQYWHLDEWAKQESWPDLFFWSSRIHFHWSWNSGKGADIWQSRSQPFNAGDSKGWGSMDEEHYGHNNLRAFYEMTGDPFIGEKIEYYSTIGAWNYYTGQLSGNRGRFNATGAERAVGRSGKESLAIAQFYPDSFAGKFLIQKDGEKLGSTITNVVNSVDNQYGFAAMGTMSDNRIQTYVDCRAGAFEPAHPRTGDCSAPILWQIPFTIEKLSQNYFKGVNKPAAQALLDKYLDDVPKYFDANGVPYTYFLAVNPTLGRHQGGIGVEWWSGWLLAAQARPQHPQSQFLLTKLKPILEARYQFLVIDQYWSNHDKWRVMN